MAGTRGRTIFPPFLLSLSSRIVKIEYFHEWRERRRERTPARATSISIVSRLPPPPLLSGNIYGAVTVACARASCVHAAGRGRDNEASNEAIRVGMRASVRERDRKTARKGDGLIPPSCPLTHGTLLALATLATLLFAYADLLCRFPWTNTDIPRNLWQPPPLFPPHPTTTTTTTTTALPPPPPPTGAARFFASCNSFRRTFSQPVECCPTVESLPRAFHEQQS